MEEKTTKTKVDEIKTTAKKKAAEVKKETVKKAKAVKGDAVKLAENTAADTVAVAKSAKKSAAKVVAAAAEGTAEVVKTAKKTTRTRKPTTKIFLQYLGKEISQDEIAQMVMDDFHTVNEGVVAKKMEIYLKPEDNAAYYVINGEFTGKVEL